MSGVQFGLWRSEGPGGKLSPTRRGYSQSWAARAVGVSRVSLWRWRKRDRDFAHNVGVKRHIRRTARRRGGLAAILAAAMYPDQPDKQDVCWRNSE